MHKIYTLLRTFLVGLFEDEAAADPLSRMSVRELADLPVHHPRA